MRRVITGLTPLVSLALVTPVQAQSLHGFEQTGRQEVRAMAGLTIPLGGKSQTRNTQPRFDLRFDTSRVHADPFRQRSLNPLLQDRRDVRATTFSLTFEAQPKLMLNGAAFASIGSPILRADEDEKAEKDKERGTGEKILRGAGWAGIGALGVLAVGAGVFLISCDDGDCFVDE